MIDKYDFGLARGETADEDIAGMRVTVDKTPEEHLSAEKIDHGSHDRFEGKTESAVIIFAAPGGSVGFEYMSG